MQAIKKMSTANVGESSSAAYDNVQGWTECMGNCFRLTPSFEQELASSGAAGSYSNTSPGKGHR